MRRNGLYVVLLVAILLCTLALPGAALAQGDQRCFGETNRCIGGRIREFWEQNGGLPIFGLPLSSQQAQTVDGRAVIAQQFERARLELHPENAPPYDVLLGRLGADLLARQNRDWQQFGKEQPQEGCRFFAESGHNLCGEFLAAWQASGLELDGLVGSSESESLALFGLPLSGLQTETLGDGKQYQVQWFERARFELHPENEPPYRVLLGLLGAELGGGSVTAPQPSTTAFGAQIWETGDAQLGELGDLNLSLVRVGIFDWSQIQPEQGAAYNWQAMADKEAMFARLSPRNLRPVVVVGRSPRWATELPTNCGAIKPEAFNDFAAFMAAAAARYSQPPFNVHMWELGNEPDVDPSLVGTDNGFGCWGKISDQYYGGEQYGAMLRVVYPAIKAADPQAQVLIGGLLLDPPDNPIRKGAPDRFLQGVLEAQKNDAQLSFDILAYHGYGFRSSSTPYFPSRGGFVLGKAAFLRDELARYGRSVPLLNTETALLCPKPRGAEAPTDECRQVQADYAARIVAESIAGGLIGSIWYHLDDPTFYNSDLVELQSRAPRPAYQAYKTAVAELSTASYLGPLGGQAEGVSGYRFRRGSDEVIIVWADQAGASARIEVAPGSSVACATRDGAELACQATDGVLSLPVSSPLYVHLRGA